MVGARARVGCWICEMGLYKKYAFSYNGFGQTKAEADPRDQAIQTSCQGCVFKDMPKELFNELGGGGGKLEVSNGFWNAVDEQVERISASGAGSGSDLVYVMCRLCAHREVVYYKESILHKCRHCSTDECMKPAGDLPLPGTAVRYLPESINDEVRLSPGATNDVFLYRHRDMLLAFRYTRPMHTRDKDIDAVKGGVCLKDEMCDGWLEVAFPMTAGGEVLWFDALRS